MIDEKSIVQPIDLSMPSYSMSWNDVLIWLDKKKHCLDSFVDLSKAFDTVDHSVIIQRLWQIGLDQAMCSWFENDLKDRTQCVPTGHRHQFHVGSMSFHWKDLETTMILPVFPLS